MSQGRPILIPVQCNPIRAPRSCLLICWSPTKQEPFTRRNSLYIAFGSSFRSMYRLSTSLFQALRWWGRRKRVGKTRKTGSRRPSSHQFSPLFVFLRFHNFRGSTAYAHRIFVVIGSLFLNIRLHSIWTIEKKRRQRRREVVIDGRCICHSWQCFQLAFMVTWKATFSAQSEKFSTNVLFF